ncbi:UNVERIFIED_CONTAM: hypothetical protein Sindi_1307500, partial [Sesamum indicum]
MQEQISTNEMTKANAFEENKSVGMKEQVLSSTAVHHAGQQTAASQQDAAQSSKPPPLTQPSHLQPPIPKVNIRAPPRWIGRQEVFPKQPLQLETISLLSTCTFLEKDGKKYCTLSRLNNVLSQSKDK